MKIFVASRQTITGLTKKVFPLSLSADSFFSFSHGSQGKTFFSFDTQGTENIGSLAIEGDNIWIGGEYVYNHFVSQNETHFYMAEDRINDLTVEHLTNPTIRDAVLACQDSQLRVIHVCAALRPSLIHSLSLLPFA